MSSDEQMAREWLALQGITGWAEGSKDYAIRDLTALLASRALEARLEQHEEDCHHCFTIKVHHPEWAPSKCPTATKLRAALEQAAASKEGK